MSISNVSNIQFMQLIHFLHKFLYTDKASPKRKVSIVLICIKNA